MWLEGLIYLLDVKMTIEKHDDRDKPEVLAYSITGAAHATDYSPRTIRKAILDGDLPAYGHNRKGNWRIFRCDLVAWLQGRPPPPLTEIDAHADPGNSIQEARRGSE